MHDAYKRQKKIFYKKWQLHLTGPVDIRKYITF